MSAAFQIFLAGHKRYATKHATFMYHQMTCYEKGKYKDLVENMEENEYLQRTIEEYVLSRTKFTKDIIDDVREKKKDFIIHSDEALRLGVIDEII